MQGTGCSRWELSAQCHLAAASGALSAGPPTCSLADWQALLTLRNLGPPVSAPSCSTSPCWSTALAREAASDAASWQASPQAGCRQGNHSRASRQISASTTMCPEVERPRRAAVQGA